MVEQIWTSNSVDDLPQIAAALLKLAGDNRKFAFYGQMGAGKTTFIKAISAALGVNEATSSPTFSIVNEYAGNYTIYHFDLFRLNDIQELQEIGFAEYLETNHYVFIEWPELIEPVLNEYEFIRIRIQTLSATSRIISLFK